MHLSAQALYLGTWKSSRHLYIIQSFNPANFCLVKLFVSPRVISRRSHQSTQAACWVGLAFKGTSICQGLNKVLNSAVWRQKTTCIHIRCIAFSKRTRTSLGWSNLNGTLTLFQSPAFIFLCDYRKLGMNSFKGFRLLAIPAA